MNRSLLALTRRLVRLEGVAADADCPACSGPPLRCVVRWTEDEPPAPCEACGRVPAPIRLRWPEDQGRA